MAAGMSSFLLMYQKSWPLQEVRRAIKIGLVDIKKQKTFILVDIDRPSLSTTSYTVHDTERTL